MTVGGVYCYVNGNPTLNNCILWGDTPQEFYTLSGNSVATYCNVQGGWPGDGNIDTDPFFVDPENGDFRLLPCSPCIDSGSNTAVPLDISDLDGDGDVSEPLPFDLDGYGRFFDDPYMPDTGDGAQPIVDMGAYEFGSGDPPPCKGDLDGDREVGIADLAVLLAYYGDGDVGIAEGDMDCDGDVDIADLAELLGVYGDVCP